MGLQVETKVSEEHTVLILLLKMEAVRFSETLLCTYKTTWHQCPDDEYRRIHRLENLTYHIVRYALLNNKSWVFYRSVMRAHSLLNLCGIVLFV
jgi:hypothetical protein